MSKHENKWDVLGAIQLLMFIFIVKCMYSCFLYYHFWQLCSDTPRIFYKFLWWKMFKCLVHWILIINVPLILYSRRNERAFNQRKNFQIPCDLNIVHEQTHQKIARERVCILDQIVHSHMLQVFWHRTNKKGFDTLWVY